MLRSRTTPAERPSPRPRRALTLALLALTALGVSTLRSPAQPDDEPQAAAAAPGKAAEKVPPFDLSFLAPDSLGAVCLRPAAVLGRPELRPALDAIDFFFSDMLRGPGLPDGLDVRLEDLEQMVCSPRIETDKKKKGPQSTFLLGLTMVRTVKDFDWKAQVKKLAPTVEEVAYAGKTYLKLPRSPAFFHIENTKGAFYCYVPDARTLVIDTEANVRRHIDGKHESPRRVWAEDWKHVENGVIALAFDMQDKQWFADRRQPEEGLDEVELVILKNTASVALGVGVENKIAIEVLMRCVGAEGSEKLARAVEGMVARGRKELEKELKESKASGFEAFWLNFQRDLLRNAQATREGAVTRWRTEARLDFAEVSRSLLSAMGSSREAEEKMKKNGADK